MLALATAPQGLPPKTLGWDVIGWAEQWLEQPDGEDAGEPWRFTDEQQRFVLWWYAVDDRGRFLYRRGVLRRMKGWGKDPLGAVIGLCELMGPVRFARWGDDGTPIAKPAAAPWIQIGATSEEQTKTTTTLLPGLLSQATINEYRLDPLLTMIHARGAMGRLEAVSNSYRSAEGNRTSLFIMNETHHWVGGNGGHQMAAVVRRNLAKSRDGAARALALTNGHSPGEDSVAERDYLAWKSQVEAGGAVDILYDSLEPDHEVDLTNSEEVLEGIRIARGDSDWLNADRILAEIQDPETAAADAHRFYLNRIVSGSGQWMDPAIWDGAYDAQDPPPPGTRITLGFDGSRTRDATAIVATDLTTGWQWLVQAWERDWLQPEWEVPVGEVNRVVREMFATFQVVRAYFDPYWWEESVSNWCGEAPDVAAAWYTGSGNAVRVARALAAYRAALDDRLCRHASGPGSLLRRHALNAIARPVGGQAGSEGLMTIGKKSRDSRECIDASMAAMLSHQARLDAIAAGALQPEPAAVGLKLWHMGNI